MREFCKKFNQRGIVVEFRAQKCRNAHVSHQFLEERAESFSYRWTVCIKVCFNTSLKTKLDTRYIE
jgi:uncharacterized metal-binding protein